MDVKFGIDVQLNAAGAIGGLNTLGQRLTNLATPGRAASIALDGVARVGQDATAQIEHGAAQAEGAWGRMAQTIGLPLSLGSMFAAVSGITSLKNATIGANAELEMTQVRMQGALRSWNDTAASAKVKSADLMHNLEAYGKETYFDFQPLANAAAIATQVTHDSKAAFDVTKLGARLAAFKGTNDPTWSTQAIVSALQGNYQSLQYSFGITANQQQIEALAAQMGGNTATNRYLALKRLIEMRVGKEGPEDTVHQMAKTWNGVANNLTDQFAVPLREMSTAGFEKLRDALVRLNNSLSAFEDSPGFAKFQKAMSDHFVALMTPAAKVIDFLGANLERLPKILETYGPALKPLLVVAGVIVGVNTAVLALKGGAGLLLTTLRGVAGVLGPFMGVVLNPLVIAGLVGLSAALWPLVKGLDIGGTTVEKRWHGLVESIIRLDLRSIFARPLQLIRDFLTQLSEGRVDWGKVLAPNSFLGDLAELSRHIRIAFTQAVVDVFPEAQPILGRLNDLFAGIKGWLGSLGVDVPKLGLALGGISLAFRALGLGNPWLLAAGAAFKGLSTSIGLVEIAIANPALAAGAALLAGLLSPLLKDIQVFGKSVGEWMDVLAGKVASVNWQNVFAGPLGWIRDMASKLSSSGFSFTDWLKGAFEPGSIFAFLGSLARPIWTGLLAALDQVAPELRGWFTDTFGNVGQVITDVLRTVTGIAGPLLDGFIKTVGPTLAAIGAVALPIISGLWKAFSGLMHWLAEVVNSPAGQGFIKFAGEIAGIVAPLFLVGRALAPVVTAGRALGSVFGGLRFVFSALGPSSGLMSILRTLGGGLVGRFPLLGTLASWAGRLMPLLARIPALLGPVGSIIARIGAFFVGGPIGIAVGVVTALVALGVLLYNRWQPFHDLVDRLGDAMRNGFKVAVEAGGQFLSWLGGLFRQVVSGWAAIGVSVAQTAHRMYDALHERLSAFGAWVLGLPSRLAGAWDGLKTGAANAAQNIYNALHERLNAFSYWFTGIPDRLAKTWDNLKAAASTLGTSIYTSLTEGIKSWVTSIPQVLSNLMDSLPAPIKAALDWVQAHTAPPAPATNEGGGGSPAPIPAPAVPAANVYPAAPVPVAYSGSGGNNAPLSVTAPLTIMNAQGMTPEEIQEMHRRHLAELLPQALNAALNGTMFV